MIITVVHSASYRYACTVNLQPHTFRLRPRMTTTQRLLSFDPEVLPVPTGATECLDQDGNLAMHAWFGAPVEELKVTSRFRVELLRASPFDFNLSAEPEHLPLRYPHPLSAALSCYSNTLHVDDSVGRFATAIAATAEQNVASFLTALNQHMFNGFAHVTRAEGPAWPSTRTLHELAGSCRDLAVLFCDVCRVLGVACRFVSGYECASAGDPDADLHARAEACLPSAGWRGYDPSRGLVVADRHMAFAAAFHADLAAPITGAFSGACGSRMEARLDMQADCS